MSMMTVSGCPICLLHCSNVNQTPSTTTTATISTTPCINTLLVPPTPHKCQAGRFPTVLRTSPLERRQVAVRIGNLTLTTGQSWSRSATYGTHTTPRHMPQAARDLAATHVWHLLLRRCECLIELMGAM